MMLLGSVTSSKIAAILDFTKNSNFSGKRRNFFFARNVKNDALNILLLLVAFHKLHYPKIVKNTHFYLKMA